MKTTSSWFSRFMDRCRSWPIKRQLVVFNLLALAVVILLLFGMMIFNLFYLKQQTDNQVGEALNRQANKNMLALITEAGGAGIEVLYDMEVTLLILSSMLKAMYDETTYSLADLPLLTYSQLPQSCMQVINETYGESPVCLQFSSYHPFTEAASNLPSMTTRFDNVLPILGSLLGGVFIRLTMYFEDAGFIRVFPGTNIESGYDPKNLGWYQTYKNNTNIMTGSGIYPDTLGNNQSVIALMAPMQDNLNNIVGVAVAEAPVIVVSQKLCNLTYLSSGSAVLLTREGILFNSSFFNSTSQNISDIDPGLWTQLQTNPTEVYTFDLHGTSYRSIGYPLNSTGSSTTWWYMILLVVPESEIMSTKGKADDTIVSASYMCIVSTALVAPVVCLSLFLCISTFTGRVVRPLHGIVKISEELSKSATENMAELQRSLNDLEEGNFQVKNLVKAFKELAMKLTDQQGPSFHEESSAQKTIVFPYNDLKREDVPWREQLKLLRNNKA